MKTHFFRASLLSFFAFLSCVASGQLRLPAVFGDHMVLQQKTDARIWGWGNSGSTIKVTGSWSKDTVSAKVANDGTWQVNLPTPAAGGPYTLSFLNEQKIVLEDVLIGEVWLCSGQSNMEWSANAGIVNAEAEVGNANHPNIRFFHVRRAGSDYPQDDCHGQWAVCSPSTMRTFSAVAYFFARQLQQQLGVPVGLINASWGGTPAEVWTDKKYVDADPMLGAYAAKLRTYDWWPKEPGRLYNAMIAPLAPMNIAGALWYQGESNVGTYPGYSRLMGTLIQNWRAAFEKDFPFYFVQIAPYTYGNPAAAEAARLREMQARCLEVPKTGMVVVSDLVDNIKDIHPRNKQDVGKRLANMALSETYGVTGLPYQFPSYQSITLENNALRVHLKDAENGLMIKAGEKPMAFEIAGADKVFVQAEARVEGNTLVVWAKNVAKPVAVRYMFSNDGVGNVFSKEGLPVAPFRSDAW